ncbi:Transcriptional regulator, MarR family [Syntrophaceticus schinkii]|uniref:Transcriptional regulator, MarR family n=1 Tax=Syntrophaceticus schinkii TaxID=499207 RepID=A0A0B7MMF6_9FIRM|nr:Transcriptional regulator, MarR family [Syntrophaceticus schinkii]
MNGQESHSLYRVFCQVVRFHYYRTYTLLEKIGVYPGQHPLLFSLAKKGGQSQKELAEKLHIKAATMTVMLNRLEKSELIKRCADDDDRRVSRVYLTEKGRKTSREVKKALKTIDEECFGNFTAEERDLLRKFLMQMRDNLLKTIDQ